MSIKIKAKNKTRTIVELGDVPNFDSSLSSVRMATITSEDGTRYINMLFKPGEEDIWLMFQIISDGRLRLMRKTADGTEWTLIKTWS